MEEENNFKKLKHFMDKIMEFSKSHTDLSDQLLNTTADAYMVYVVSDLMKEKLDKAREAGLHGWWDRDHFDDEELQYKFQNATESTDPISLINVINYSAMMLMRYAVVVVEEYEPEKSLTAVYMGCEFNVSLDLADLFDNGTYNGRQWYMRANPIGDSYICDGWIPEEKAGNAIDAFMYACDGAMLPVPTVEEITAAINKFKSEG